MPKLFKRRWALFALPALLLTLTVASAEARAPIAELRVEGVGKTLEPGASFVTATESFVAANDVCSPTGGTHKVPGPTAMGILGSAFEVNALLRPLYVIEDEFGQRVCRAGEFTETDDPFTGWLYRVNHEAPPASAALVEIGNGDEVLWYFANFGSGANTGDELVLASPPRARPGEPFEVRVHSYSFEGVRAPASGVNVIGAAAPTDGEGRATVTLGETTTLVASRGDDIPSEPLPVCVAADLDQCPRARGERIFGTAHGDRIPGTPGPDRIRSRAGRDRVNVRGGGADRIDCGPGRDVVLLGGGDRERRCERALRG